MAAAASQKVKASSMKRGFGESNHAKQLTPTSVPNKPLKTISDWNGPTILRRVDESMIEAVYASSAGAEKVARIHIVESTVKISSSSWGSVRSRPITVDPCSESDTTMSFCRSTRSAMTPAQSPKNKPGTISTMTIKVTGRADRVDEVTQSKSEATVEVDPNALTVRAKQSLPILLSLTSNEAKCTSSLIWSHRNTDHGAIIVCRVPFSNRNSIYSYPSMRSEGLGSNPNVPSGPRSSHPAK